MHCDSNLTYRETRKNNGGLFRFGTKRSEISQVLTSGLSQINNKYTYGAILLIPLTLKGLMLKNYLCYNFVPTLCPFVPLVQNFVPPIYGRYIYLNLGFANFMLRIPSLKFEKKYAVILCPFFATL